MPGDRDASMAHQMKYLSPDDIEMLRQGNEIIQNKIFKCEQCKVLNKEIWFGYLDFWVGEYIGMLYICYVKLYSQTSRRHSISLKILLSGS